MSAAQRFPAAVVPPLLADIVRAARLRKKWSQARLAERARIARASVYRLEAEPSAARPDTIFRIAAALGLEMADLVPAWPEWETVTSAGHGVRTRERRRARGVTLARAAAAAGVSEATLSRFERGVVDSPALLGRVGDERVCRNEGLAHILGFADPGEHDDFCRGLTT